MSPGAKNFLFVGNQGCIDFVNTEIMDQGRKQDLFDNFNDLTTWMVSAKMMTAVQAERVTHEWPGARSFAALNQARDFRTTMRPMVDQIARGKAVPQTALREINQLLRAGSGHSQVVKKGGGFERAVQGDFIAPAQLLAKLAEAAADLLCNCDLSLVKRCKNPACILYFYDTTKNHQRNWCSMKICGNRMKVAAFYLRSRSLRPRPAKRTQTDH